jgi:hypothetical protein|tara:strand:+ start:444 stop:860 length:417 start_codon:yes stop_codon:yes gene_type:complete
MKTIQQGNPNLFGAIKDSPRRVVIDPKEAAVEYCEAAYPETCKMFKEIMADQYILFCKKQKNYGPSNISVGTNLTTNEDVKLSLTGLWFRVNDKVQRLKQLIILGHNDEVGESEIDTFQDLSVYGIIAQIVSAKVWGK